MPEHFRYEAFRDSISIENYDASTDTANLFDAGVFEPGVDSVEKLLIRIDTLWRLETTLIEGKTVVKKVAVSRETCTENDKEVIIDNVRMLDSFFVHRNDTLNSGCREKECPVYAEVIKSVQKLYLYIEGELKDSFKVSTGARGYETPAMNLRPSGPVFTKYTSKKFPGGNYEGLGNMPYAVFLRGGYAIHGTTKGNFSKLGTPASHGCIRLHPNNAKIFNGIIKLAGVENTWVKITRNRESENMAE
jgi:hypothetical protein